MEWLILRNAGNNEKTNKSTESKHKIAKKNLDTGTYFLEFHYVSFNLNMTTFFEQYLHFCRNGQFKVRIDN